MSVTGQRKRLKDGIIKILSEWLLLEYRGDYEEVAADIMALVPKPEKTVIHRKETEIFKIPFYKCGKCGGLITPKRTEAVLIIISLPYVRPAYSGLGG